jgi:WhiB family redox-sensing transcriptional regulator
LRASDGGEQTVLPPPDQAWADRAACRDVVAGPDDDVFFAPEFEDAGSNRYAFAEIRAQRELAALAICDGCPVRAECLSFAVETRQDFGVWGGRTEQQLRRLISQSGRAEWRPRLDVGTRRGPRVGSERPASRRTHCPAGHPYDEGNTRRYGTRRVCRTCQAERARTQQLATRPTHCPKGHPYDQTNTAFDARGRRKCRACTRARALAERRWHEGQRVRRATGQGRGCSS